MTNKLRDCIVSVVMLVLGIGMFVVASGIQHMIETDVGSGYVPKFLAICIIVAALAKLILSVIDKDPANAVKQGVFDDWFGGIATILIMAAYMLLMEPVGFIVSSIVYLFIQILLLSDDTNRKPVLFAIIAVVAPIAISALFSFVIKMPLPRGIIGF